MKILGMDGAYDEAIESRGRNMLISANLVAEMIIRIRELEMTIKRNKKLISK